ncbi:MAG: S8 family serine peptidase [candidate division Zixibacteria bacterium]
MKQTLTKSFVLLVPTIFLLLAGSVSARYDNIPGNVIVTVAQGQDVHEVLNRHDLTIVDSIGQGSVYLLSFDPDKSVADMIDELLVKPGIDDVQPNHGLELPTIHQISLGFPDQQTPTFDQSLSPVPYYNQAAVSSISLDSAHLFTTGAGISIGVIDNGIEASHPLFAAGQLSPGYDFLDGDSSPEEVPGLTLGHGTFVSGMILLAAPDCNLVPLRAFGSDGIGNEFAVVQAIYYAIRNKIDVLNMSFGTSIPSPLLHLAIDQALEAGIVLVASAGNEGSVMPLYPAAFPGVLAISAIDEDELLADMSNFGSHVSLCAPGVNLYSSFAGEYEWGWWSGTSFATPLVAGSAALLKATNRLSSYEVAWHLQMTARRNPAWGNASVPDIQYGFGIADAYSSLVSVNRGDLDFSGHLDMLDLTNLANLLLNAADENSDAFALTTIHNYPLADIDGNGVVDDSDVLLLVEILFFGTPRPGPVYDIISRK